MMKQLNKTIFCCKKISDMNNINSHEKVMGYQDKIFFFVVFLSPGISTRKKIFHANLVL